MLIHDFVTSRSTVSEEFGELRPLEIELHTPPGEHCKDCFLQRIADCDQHRKPSVAYQAARIRSCVIGQVASENAGMSNALHPFHAFSFLFVIRFGPKCFNPSARAGRGGAPHRHLRHWPIIVGGSHRSACADVGVLLRNVGIRRYLPGGVKGVKRISALFAWQSQSRGTIY
jgi:hypothetical protein